MRHWRRVCCRARPRRAAGRNHVEDGVCNDGRKGSKKKDDDDDDGREG